VNNRAVTLEELAATNGHAPLVDPWPADDDPTGEESPFPPDYDPDRPADLGEPADPASFAARVAATHVDLFQRIRDGIPVIDYLHPGGADRHRIPAAASRPVATHVPQEPRAMGDQRPAPAGTARPRRPAQGQRGRAT